MRSSEKTLRVLWIEAATSRTVVVGMVDKVRELANAIEKEKRVKRRQEREVGLAIFGDGERRL